MATELGWTVAANLRDIVPIGDLADTTQYAILNDLAAQQREHTEVTEDGDDEPPFYRVLPSITRMLAWLIRYNPKAATATIAETTNDAGRYLNIPREVVIEALEGIPEPGRAQGHPHGTPARPHRRSATLTLPSAPRPGGQGLACHVVAAPVRRARRERGPGVGPAGAGWRRE